MFTATPTGKGASSKRGVCPDALRLTADGWQEEKNTPPISSSKIFLSFI
jgi:hypothetical protein